MRILAASDIEKALPMRKAIEAVRQAFLDVSAGRSASPLRTVMEVGPGNLVAVMPVHAERSGVVAVKVISAFPGNRAEGLPLVHALVEVLDARTGAPLAVLEGGSLTRIRTGAASGVATALLARDDSRVAGIFGAGVQGRAQLEAVAAVRDIREAFVWDPDAGAAGRFSHEMSARLGIAVRVASGPSEALSRADVVCTATTSSEPVFSDADVKPGTHINAVGSHLDSREIPGPTVARSLVYVDSRAASSVEAGDLLLAVREGSIPAGHIVAELGEALERPGLARRSRRDVTLFKSVGLAVQDAAAALVALAEAERLGLGTVLELT